MDLKTYISAGERGRAARLAKDLGVSASYLSQMASGSAPISPERAVAIEKLTDCAVTRKDTHPADWHLIWPELAEVDRRSSPGRRRTDRKEAGNA